MEFSLFVGKDKKKNSQAEYREENINDLSIVPGLKIEEQEAFFRKIAAIHVNGLDARTIDTIRKFTKNDDPDRRTLYLPEVVFQNRILELVVNNKLNNLPRFVSDYTRYFVEEKNKNKKDEIEPEAVRNVQRYIEGMMLGVEKVAEVVEEIDSLFKDNEQYKGMDSIIGTNNTLDVKHKIDLVQIISEPFSNEILEVILVQVKRGIIDPNERHASEYAHQEYIDSLDIYSQAHAFKNANEAFIEANQEAIIEKRIQLLNALHEKYGYFGVYFFDQNIEKLKEIGITDTLILGYLHEVEADFSIDELATLVRSRDAHQLFNITDDPKYDEHLKLLEIWAGKHELSQNTIDEKIPIGNIARAQKISSVIVDKNTTFAKGYKNKISLKERQILTAVA